VPDWLSDLFSPPSTAITPLGGGGLPPAIAKPLEVPQALVPMLTDSVIRQISASTGALVTLRQDTRNLGYSLVLFSGPAPAQQRAREMIQQQCGLTASPNSKKIVDLQSYHPSAYRSLSNVLNEYDMKAKMGNLPVKVLPPEFVGGPIKAHLGPAPIAHIATAEAAVRKALRDVELDLHWKERRVIPAQLKSAKMCKSVREGNECTNIMCVSCHTQEELRIATSCCLEVAGLDKEKVSAPALGPPVTSSQQVSKEPAKGASGGIL